MKREYAIDKLIENADKCVNMLDLCHKMGIENVGGEDYKEIRQLADELGIELKFSYKRDTILNHHPRISTSDILVENSKYKDATKIKKRLLKEGIKENKCECCGLTEWQGKPISLQIHHINGVHNDNRIENIQILCPNCHSQTDTYSGRNSNRENNTKYLKKEKSSKQISNCHRPSKGELIESFKKLGNFVKVGKKYNVSDNSIRKWCDYYGLPRTKKELTKFINRRMV